MKRFSVLLVLLALAAAMQAQNRKPARQKFPIGGSYPSGAKLGVVSDLDKRLAQFKRVQMPFNRAGLTARQVQLVNKLVEASRYLEYIYWRQNDPEGLTLYQQLKGSTSPRDQKILRYLWINGGRFDLVHENEPFLAGAKFSPGHGLYPPGLTRERIEQYVKEHPEKKDELYSSYTVVRQRGADLEAIPYNVAYRTFLAPAAKALREAAALSDDKAFAEFLRARADALLTDDYYKSDLLWIDLKNPKIDVVFAPYESYIDEVLGVKTAYGASVLIRNDAESKKLAVFQQYVPAIQEALPLAKEDKPSKQGLSTPMEVVDSPFRSGDATHGYQSVATNLPNDPRIHKEKGTKKIFFKNFMDARVNYVILPVARRLMAPQQARQASAEGYLTCVMLHEISHGLGPAFARTAAGTADIREAIGPIYSALEEAKADVTGMFGLRWLVENKALPAARVQEYYASYLAGILRSVRFGVAEAHGRAQMMEFNYLVEQGAIVPQAPANSKVAAKGVRPVVRYAIDYAKMPAALDALARELLEIEATGDRQRAEKWFARYDKMPSDLKAGLESIRDIPVDVDPVFSFPETVQ